MVAARFGRCLHLLNSCPGDGRPGDLVLVLVLRVFPVVAGFSSGGSSVSVAVAEPLGGSGRHGRPRPCGTPDGRGRTVTARRRPNRGATSASRSPLRWRTSSGRPPYVGRVGERLLRRVVVGAGERSTGGVAIPSPGSAMGAMAWSLPPWLAPPRGPSFPARAPGSGFQPLSGGGSVGASEAEMIRASGTGDGVGCQSTRTRGPHRQRPPRGSRLPGDGQHRRRA